MSRILGIDPGNTESAYAIIDQATRRPLAIDKISNHAMLGIITTSLVDRMAIEMVSSYGMAVGREVFDTCVWVGRFAQQNERREDLTTWRLVYRADVKLHHCQSRRAKDAEVTRALLDRFAYGVPNRGKGTKTNPGWFHGFRADIWQAYALAVYDADTTDGRMPGNDQADLLAPTL